MGRYPLRWIVAPSFGISRTRADFQEGPWPSWRTRLRRERRYSTILSGRTLSHSFRAEPGRMDLPAASDLILRSRSTRRKGVLRDELSGSILGPVEGRGGGGGGGPGGGRRSGVRVCGCGAGGWNHGGGGAWIGVGPG